MVRWECSILGREAFGVREGVLVARIRGHASFGAISGSPVVSDGGQLLGAVVSRYSFAEDPYVGVLPKERIEEHWRYASAVADPGPGLNATETDAWRRIIPGCSVVALRAWGDYTSGMFGTVCEVREREVALLGHPWQGGGPCMYALARAPVRAMIHDMGLERVADVSDIVGVVFYDGKGGLFGRLGVQPPVIRLCLEMRNAAGALLRGYSYWIADDPFGRDLSMREVLIDGTHSLSGTANTGRWNLGLECDGAAVWEATLESLSSETVTTAFFDGLKRATGTHSQPHSILVKLQPE